MVWKDSTKIRTRTITDKCCSERCARSTFFNIHLLKIGKRKIPRVACYFYRLNKEMKNMAKLHNSADCIQSDMHKCSQENLSIKSKYRLVGFNLTKIVENYFHGWTSKIKPHTIIARKAR